MDVTSYLMGRNSSGGGGSENNIYIINATQGELVEGEENLYNLIISQNDIDKIQAFFTNYTNKTIVFYLDSDLNYQLYLIEINEDGFTLKGEAYTNQETIYAYIYLGDEPTYTVEFIQNQS